MLGLSCNLIALILGWNYAKGYTVTKIVKEIKFEGVWGKLKAKKISTDNHSQNLRLTLVSLWNSALRESLISVFQ